jgi:hypothetical protein
MRQLLAFLILSSVKIFSHLFYRAEFKWISTHPDFPWEKARLIVLLNHTSLFEPLYIRRWSFAFIWRLLSRLNVPGADITLKRPLVGKFWKLMLPSIASVSRKSDSTWKNYLTSIRDDSIILIAAEGRMKRPNGLDKSGRPMTVKGGTADILEEINDGGMILCLSGGLHHIQKPGQHLPRLFKKLKMNFIYVDIAEYKKTLSQNPRERKIKMVADLQRHLENDCPKI